MEFGDPGESVLVDDLPIGNKVSVQGGDRLVHALEIGRVTDIQLVLGAEELIVKQFCDVFPQVFWKL